MKILKRTRKTTKKISFSEEKLREDILREARVLSKHMGAVNLVVEKVLPKIKAWVEARGEITEDDLNRVVSRELRKYDEDLAYVYENRGRII